MHWAKRALHELTSSTLNISSHFSARYWCSVCLLSLMGCCSVLIQSVIFYINLQTTCFCRRSMPTDCWALTMKEKKARVCLSTEVLVHVLHPLCSSFKDPSRGREGQRESGRRSGSTWFGQKKKLSQRNAQQPQVSQTEIGKTQCLPVCAFTRIVCVRLAWVHYVPYETNALIG